MSVTADAGDISSIKNAFNTIRTKLGNDPEVLLYNASGFQLGKLHLSFFQNRVYFFFKASVLDLKPEALQTALNISVVGALVASQEVRRNKERIHFSLHVL